MTKTDAATARYLTPPEVAKRLGVDPNTVRRWIASGALPAVLVGNRYRIAEASLELVCRAVSKAS